MISSTVSESGFGIVHITVIFLNMDVSLPARWPLNGLAAPVDCSKTTVS